MYLPLLSSIVAVVLPVIIYLLSTLLTIKTLNDREKSSPFECGFDPNHSARIPFSIRFFLLAIIFIVFDIEIVLLIPIPLLILTSNRSLLITTVSIFLIILVLGLLYEWIEGSLDWSK
jgi:NADH-ubiquinone oxidoreductase chain 3